MRYSIVNNASRLEIAAKSSLHPINGTSHDVRGFLEVQWNDGALSLEPAPQMHFEIPVDSLSSGSSLEDEQMRSIVGSKSFPKIVADLRQLRALNVSSRYAAEGQIEVHGTSRTYDGEIEVREDGKRVIVAGERTIDVRDFGINPPRILMFKVFPDVTVRLHVVAEPEAS